MVFGILKLKEMELIFSYILLNYALEVLHAFHYSEFSSRLSGLDIS